MDEMDVSDAHFPVVVLFVELLTCYRSDCAMSGVCLVVLFVEELFGGKIRT